MTASSVSYMEEIMRENKIGIPNLVCNEKQVREHYACLTKTLIEKGITISTMESATSGQIASLITDTEGASAVFRGAYVTYSNETKIMCGVSKDIIDKYSVYSEEAARDMASVCRDKFNTNIGIGVTGTMGNIDPNNKASSQMGKVYFSIDIDGQVEAYSRRIPPQPTRLLYKLFVADMIYMELAKALDNL